MSFCRAAILSAVFTFFVVSSSRASDTGGPLKGPDASCFNSSNARWYGPGELTTLDQLKAAREAIVKYLESETAVQACWLGAIAKLRREWASKQQQPIAIVEAAVANAVAQSQYYKELRVKFFSFDASRYNAYASKDGTELVVPLDVPPVPAADERLAKPGGLMMPSYGIADSHVCISNYPSLAQRMALSGDVSFGFDVDINGGVNNVHVIKSAATGVSDGHGTDILDAAALACVNHWRNYPEIRDGVPVPSPGHESVINYRIN